MLDTPIGFRKDLLHAGLCLLAAIPATGASAVDGLPEARRFYAGRPRVERPQAGWQESPRGLDDLRASSCANCHRAIYEEWRVSTHAQAWTDRQFQAELRKSGNRWLCANCHTPLLNQMESWAVGLVDGDVEHPLYTPNPRFEPNLRAEGITCAACHVRDGTVEGPTGISTPAHPTRRSSRFTDASICLTCHQAVRSYPGKDFICIFETGQEWRNGPYGQAGQPCQACHMRPVVRPQAEGSPARTGRRHYWPGAGIPKEPGRGPPLDQLAPGLGIEVIAEGETLILHLTNASAGHMLPTGDPERFIRVEVRFADGHGDAIGEIHRERIGQTWTWWPEPEKVNDNRLAPLEMREVSIPRPAGAIAWSVVASSHRISQEALEHHDLEGYPASRITHTLAGRFEE